MVETEILKEHYEESILANANLIIQNKLQIEIAEAVIKVLEEKVAQFPEEDAPVSNDEGD